MSETENKSASGSHAFCAFLRPGALPPKRPPETPNTSAPLDLEGRLCPLSHQRFVVFFPPSPEDSGASPREGSASSRRVLEKASRKIHRRIPENIRVGNEGRGAPVNRFQENEESGPVCIVQRALDASSLRQRVQGKDGF